jgi:hypothetical protein
MIYKSYDLSMIGEAIQRSANAEDTLNRVCQCAEDSKSFEDFVRRITDYTPNDRVYAVFAALLQRQA